MTLKRTIRVTYLLGWAFAILALLYDIPAFYAVVPVPSALRFNWHSIMAWSGLLFVICIASVSYAQAMERMRDQEPQKAKAAKDAV